MEHENNDLLKLVKIQTAILAVILAIILAVAAVVGVQYMKISRFVRTMDTSQITAIVGSLENAAQGLEEIDMQALKDGIAAFGEISEKAGKLDVEAMNDALKSMSGAVDNLSKLDADHLNSLIESLQKTSTQIEKITSIFVRK